MSAESSRVITMFVFPATPVAPGAGNLDKMVGRVGLTALRNWLEVRALKVSRTSSISPLNGLWKLPSPSLAPPTEKCWVLLRVVPEMLSVTLWANTPSTYNLTVPPPRTAATWYHWPRLSNPLVAVTTAAPPLMEAEPVNPPPDVVAINS